ncbi:SRPBCC family protein [Pricia sp. S334]|uniref:SRPBCC family protein n=1 Tax=Pricia mediterranea TaxID=3076079 RepID=A0ABU3L873_9FLAO|nr:SRPBCC family protein [Pricia sp. S334]MDT7829389.1 SRPBCC family protein [Pricia sp. S334]
METKDKLITVEATVKAPVVKVWELWTTPEHIKNWNRASDEWHTTKAENDLRAGGKFVSRMEAKDGSMGFDFGGTYDEVRAKEGITYTLDDGRKVEIVFSSEGNKTNITETFEPENTNPAEMQREGWQAILDNFKKYAESKN